MKYAQALLPVTIAVLASFYMPASAQNTQTPGPIVVPFDAVHWTTKGNADDDILDGLSCIKLTNGEMALRDPGFENGTIDFDMAVDHFRYFPGMGFRMKDTANGEIYYLRPHQSGNPDAMQYFPEFSGADGWQLYYGDGFNSAKIIPFQQWIHFHFVIKDTAAEIFWNDEKTPALFISRLQRRPAAGYIVLTNGGSDPAWFANFSYQKTNAVNLVSQPPAPIVLPVTRITHWDISDPFDETMLTGKTAVAKTFTGGLQWHAFDADQRGIADLSRLSPHSKGSNTVFARTIIHASQPGIRKFSFGFSDRARLFLNGTLLYSGADEFRSRDYRFLGTIGLFDAVYLPVRKGDNEVLMAVSEDFGGWGLEAQLE